MTPEQVRERWDAFSNAEKNMIHHSLRLLVRHPLTSADDVQLSTSLADEIWELHAAEVAASLSPAASPDEGETDA